MITSPGCAIFAAAKNPGKFIFTTLNGLFPLYHSVEEFFDSKKQDGIATYGTNSFDLMTLRDHNITEMEDDSGKMRALSAMKEHPELQWTALVSALILFIAIFVHAYQTRATSPVAKLSDH